ncbi:CHAT domain-containing protein [Pedobacter suwonensis]|uniref:CHAT domain-containing protein n=1 Tax=Pedobacter suwonensis TaxID=332999 RepID=UPI0011A0FA38|nr:CHAT domain-containing protein [Pedobacter suwonensis]
MEFHLKLADACKHGIEAYKLFFAKIIKEGLDEHKIKEIVCLLEDINDDNPSFVKEAASLQLTLSKEEHGSTIVASYYLLITALIKLKLFHDMPNILRLALEACLADDHGYHYGVIICQNIKKNLTDNDLSQDSILIVLKIVSDYYLSIDQIEEAIAVKLSAVRIFAGARASQSAYRLVNEIEHKVIDRDKEELLAPVYAALAEAGVSEDDHVFAEEVFNKSHALYKKYKIEIPFGTMTNYATVKIRLKKPEEALKIYREIIKGKHGQIDRYREFFINYHMGICYKDLGKLQKAEKIFTGLEAFSLEFQVALKRNIDTSYIEGLIDYLLCFSLVLALQKHYSKSLLILLRCIKNIEILLSTVFRPHFKRGLREKYVNRILSIIDFLAEELPTEKLLPIFCYLKQNSQSDWLAVNSWMEHINSTGHVPTEELQRINTTFKILQDEGGVLMIGFNEKYDDPFQNPNLLELELAPVPENLLPWQEFESAARALITKYKLPDIYKRGANAMAELIQGKIKEGIIVLFGFFRSRGNVVYTIDTEKRASLAVPYEQKARNFIQSTGEYQRGAKKDSFVNDLLFYTEEIKSHLDPLILAAVQTDAKGIYYFPSVFDAAFPIVQTLLSDTRISSRLKVGNFFIQVCPLMYQAKTMDFDFDKVAIIQRGENALELFQEEVVALKRNFEQVSEHQDLHSLSGDVDLIHIISHGQPISIFSDPGFSTLNENHLHLFSFSKIESKKLKLVYFNACNAGDTINRNHQKIYSTHELAGFTTASLQNNGTLVMASQWPTLDLVSFLYAKLFYSNLKEDKNIRSAYSKTIWQIKNETREFFEQLISEIADEKIRHRRLEGISMAPEKPFDNIFLYSGMLLYGLI